MRILSDSAFNAWILLPCQVQEFVTGLFKIVRDTMILEPVLLAPMVSTSLQIAHAKFYPQIVCLPHPLAFAANALLDSDLKTALASE
jgi:hypothetical protein